MYFLVPVTLVRDNANSVRQIAAAVGQQDAGIVQISRAITDLTRIMDQTLAQLGSSEQAITVVLDVSEKMSGVVEQYRWSEGALSSSP